MSFEDVTVRAGLADFRHASGSSDKAYILEALGSGVAMLDLDGDGLLDIYLANGGALDTAGGSIASTRSAALYRNRGDGTFVDVARDAGVTNDRWGRGSARATSTTTAPWTCSWPTSGPAASIARSPSDGMSTPPVSPSREARAATPSVTTTTTAGASCSSSTAMSALLFRNLQGRRFEEVGAAAGPALTTSARPVGDYDNGGAVDILIGVIDGAPVLATNLGGAAAGHWRSVRLIGDPAQRCPRVGIGSTVRAVVGARRLHGEITEETGAHGETETRRRGGSNLNFTHQAYSGR